MLPRRYIEEWKKFAPWPEDSQVEQDLVIEVTVVFKFEGIEMYKAAQSYALMADKAFKKGKYSRATKLYNRAIGIYPNHALMLYQRGLAKYYNGDSKGALSDFERSVYLGGHIADPLLARLLEDEYMQNIGIN